MKFKQGQTVRFIEGAHTRNILTPWTNPDQIAYILHQKLYIREVQAHSNFGYIYRIVDQQGNINHWIAEQALRPLRKVNKTPVKSEVEWLNRVQANFREG